MDYEVRIEEVAARPLAAVHEARPWRELMPRIREFLDEVWGFLRANGITTGHNVIVYGTNETWFGVEVFGPLPPNDRVVSSATPAGHVATTAHFGPYDQLPTANAAVRSWYETHGHTLAGRSWEVYGDWEEDTSKLRTDVFYLLK